ncbi:MAG TPA: hypothetical protein VN739_11010 [Nitrososphaerales archaeon]|nr:hypothetical protein [Nitrososphaerales archaeon]
MVKVTAISIIAAVMIIGVFGIFFWKLWKKYPLLDGIASLESDQIRVNN